MPHTILLADDSVTIQKVVELTFSEGDYRVLCVSNGKAAVQKIQESRPDLLLCDVIMPEMNGYEVASFVKKNPAYSAIPVILLTGTFEPFDEEKARQSGADTYITKPFESKMLVEKVEELLRRRPVFDAEAGLGPVQVFHSRTEFTIGEPEPVQERPERVEPPPVRTPFGEGEHEFAMPAEEVVAQAGSVPVEPLSAPAPIAGQATPAAAAPAEAEELPLAKDEAEALLAGEQNPEVVDLGPLPEEAALSESDFESVLAPQEGAPAGRSADVEIPPLLAGEPDQVELERALDEPLPAEGVAEASPWEEAGPEPAVSAQAPASVEGAEDWGAGQTLGKPAEELKVTPPAPAEAPVLSPLPAEEPGPFEVVHEMTDQQEMVSEAQAAGLEEPGETVSPVSEAELEPAPVPQEGVETTLAEVSSEQEQPSLQEAEATAEIPVMMPAVAGVPAWNEQELERMVASKVAEELGPNLKAALGEALPVALRTALAGELPGLVQSAVADQAPEVARRAVREMAPSLIRQLVDDTAPPLVAGAVREIIPDTLRDVVREQTEVAVRQLASQDLPVLVKEAASQRVEEDLPAALSAALQERVAQAVRELAPEIIRQVAWEVIPELAESLIKRRIQELESQAG
jgi:CheY-like chemotaxis protein